MNFLMAERILLKTFIATDFCQTEKNQNSGFYETLLSLDSTKLIFKSRADLSALKLSLRRTHLKLKKIGIPGDVHETLCHLRLKCQKAIDIFTKIH